MAKITINDLLHGLDEAPNSLIGDTARSVVTRERDAILNYLDSGGTAYGFSTFFGHLDNHTVKPEDSQVLLDAHLVGTPRPLSEKASRAITLVKLCQLMQGGSGISPETFDRVVEGLDRTVSIDLDASYGSGDVVPGAWWVQSVLGPTPDFQRGDLIALINGSFVPVGLLLHAVQPLESLFSTVVWSADAARDFAQRRNTSGVQLPVSIRDTRPLKKELADGLTQLKSAIESSANRQSSNPSFVLNDDKGTVSVCSNSSFLNYECLAAVRRVGMSLSVAAGYSLAIINHVSGTLEKESDVNHGVEWVQVPKVAKAYYDNLMDTLTFSGSKAQWTSGGAEDVSDFLLADTRKLIHGLEIAEKLVGLLTRCVGEPTNT